MQQPNCQCFAWESAKRELEELRKAGRIAGYLIVHGTLEDKEYFNVAVRFDGAALEVVGMDRTLDAAMHRARKNIENREGIQWPK